MDVRNDPITNINEKTVLRERHLKFMLCGFLEFMSIGNKPKICAIFMAEIDISGKLFFP
jgi:hypothetical protein